MLVLVVSIYHARSFHFDASSETLVVEGDPDLMLYKRVAEVFGAEDFLFVTFRPDSEAPITPAALSTLDAITTNLANVDGVSGVFSILDAPLLKSPPMALAELNNGFPTLRSADVDFELAQKELANSPFFSELLITADATATAIRVDLSPDKHLRQITAQRESMLAQANVDAGE
jgi:predicted RND superfamily exporter protein